jgi:PadR family transcriptional regulator, regulatory protein PadR
MASTRIRLTTPVRMVLDALAHAGPDDPLWGYKLTELTGLGSGTIYPIMERLESSGYVTARVETPRPADRPRRRFYELTGTGRQLAASAAVPRESRLRAFRIAPERPGTA